MAQCSHCSHAVMHALMVSVLCLSCVCPALSYADSFEEVRYAIRNKDFKRAATLLEVLASDGHKDAQYQLAALYRGGQGVTQDHSKAASWYKKAAEQGHVKAQYNLGVLYEQGWGVDKSTDQAHDWYEKAGREGHSLAQAKLNDKQGGNKGRNPEDTAVEGLSIEDRLHWAAIKGDFELASALLEQGASVDAEDQYGATALIKASEQGHTSLVRLFLEKQADSNHSDNFADTALLKAVTSGHPDIVELLVNAKASVNQPDANGNTALMMASRAGDLTAARLLLASGASGSQIRMVSYGEERPAVEGHDEGAWSKNRRVEVRYE